MPLPIITDLYLCRLIWSNVGAPRQATNDLYFKDNAGGHTGTDVYNAINANVTANMWLLAENNSQVINVKTTKLDGTAATVDHLTGAPAKWTGSGGTTFIPQAANVVTIRTGFRGRSRRGRIYIPFTADIQSTGGTLSSSNVATSQTAWGTFLTAMIAAGYPLHVMSKLHNDSVQAASVTVQPYLKTQRRRARR